MPQMKPSLWMTSLMAFSMMLLMMNSMNFFSKKFMINWKKKPMTKKIWKW